MKGNLKGYLGVLIEHEIVRRYALVNSFDGVLTILGIILAEFFSGIKDPMLIILPGVGAGIALFVSGIWSAYAAERAEVKKNIRNLEAHLMHNLSGTEFSKKREKMAIFIGLVNGLSPLIAGLVLIIPFVIVILGEIHIQFAYYLSIFLAAVLLFMLGAISGRIARESMLRNGLVMLFAGIVIAIIFILLHTISVL